MNFDYNLDLTDKTIEEVTEEEKFYGYDKSLIHSFDSTYESLYNDISKDDDIQYHYIYPSFGFDENYVRRSIKLWKELGINLHDLVIIKRFKNVDKLTAVNRKFFKSISTENPSKLKLSFKNIIQTDSELKLLRVNDPLYKGIVFDRINLPKLEKKLVSTIYAHEITHTQLETRNGGTNSYFNIEMIPIFMEYVFASVQKEPKISLSFVQNERLKSIFNFLCEMGLSDRVPYSRRITCEQFLISSIQAIKLFDVYYRGNESIKKEILEDINKVFDGRIIVEDIINKYGVSYDNGENNLKKLKLKF